MFICENPRDPAAKIKIDLLPERKSFLKQCVAILQFKQTIPAQAITIAVLDESPFFFRYCNG